ncbi:MAG: hypothetical protein ACKOYH_01815 [Cyanobium sp.]
MASAPKTAASVDRRTAVPAHVRRLAVVLEVLALLALLSGAFPLAFSSPIWWLRLADSLVNLAPVLLLAVILLRIASLYLSPNDDAGITLIPRTVQLASRWGLVFALLVPLQLICFGWLWVDSGNQLNGQLSQATSKFSALSARLNAAGSDAELQRLLATTTPGLLPPLPPGSLAQQKTQLTAALDLSRSRLQTNLSRQRTSTLVNSIPGTLRVVLGAAIVSAFMLTIRRHFQ